MLSVSPGGAGATPDSPEGACAGGGASGIPGWVGSGQVVQVQIFLFGPKILSLSSILIRQRVGHGPTHGPKKSCMIRGHIQGRRRRGVRGDLEVSGNGIRTVVCTCTLHPEGARVRLRTEQRHRRADAVVRARAAGRGGSPPPRDRQIGDIFERMMGQLCRKITDRASPEQSMTINWALASSLAWVRPRMSRRLAQEVSSSTGSSANKSVGRITRHLARLVTPGVNTTRYRLCMCFNVSFIPRITHASSTHRPRIVHGSSTYRPLHFQVIPRWPSCL